MLVHGVDDALSVQVISLNDVTGLLLCLTYCSPERLAALAAAAYQPGGLPGALPEGELISEAASRLDAFSGYPFRA